MTDLLTRKGVSLDRLSAFLAVFEAGGIARAVPGQPVRQSQLSRQLKELESALECTLFTRVKKNLVPTEAGAKLARVVRELKAGLQSAAGERAARVRLAAGDSMLCWLVLPALQEWWRACPSLELEVTARAAPEAAAALVDYECDLALMRDDFGPAGLKTVRLGVVTYEVFAAKGLDWRAAPLVVATTERGVWPFLERLGRPVVACDTFPQVAAAVRSGQAAGVLPSYARYELPAAGFRRHPERGLDGAATPLLLAWRSKADAVQPELTPVRRALEQLVRRRL